MSEFYKDWNASKSQNNNGSVPFYRPIELTPEEKEQACKNIGVASNDAIERLEGEFTDLRGDMAVVEGNVNTALTAVNDAVISANGAVTAANAALSQVSAVTADVANISAKADSNSDNIDVLSAKVDTNIANIVAISGKNTVQDNRLDDLEYYVNGLTNSATYHDAKIQNLENDWTTYSADLRNDFNTFSAAEDAVITAATAAIPGQVSAEVSGQLSGKQDKLTTGVNISLNKAGVIDLHNNQCSATQNSVAIGDKSKSINDYGFVHGRYATNAGKFNAILAAYNESASGTYNLVAGSSNVVDGNWNTVVGSGNTVTANNFNFLQGVGNTIGNVQGAHAEGNRTYALSDYSHSEGQYTITDTIGQHVEGQYNAPAVGALHVIGNGTSNAQRSNAWEVYADKIIANVPLYANNIPTPPTANGTYSLQVVVNDGKYTYSWV